MNNETMIKSAKRIDSFCKIAQGFMVAGIIVCAIFIPLTLIFGEAIVADGNTLSIGSISFIMNPGYEPEFSALSVSILSTLVFGILICALFWYGIRIFRNILNPMKEGLPFDSQMPRYLKKLGTIMIAGSLIVQICQTAAARIALRVFNLSELISTPAINRINFNFELDFTFIFIGIVIYFLAYVFRYGEQLQRESDETL